uniref:DNA topoisomerase (ATP-hydrolyzing) n=1 Tax=Arundo donax TaxID=35708 RepID=A0A0A9GCB0_ARUDO
MMCLRLCVICSSFLSVLQVSFVNKTETIAGGTHVDYVSNLVANHVASVMNKTFVQTSKIEEHDVKRHLGGHG